MGRGEKYEGFSEYKNKIKEYAEQIDGITYIQATRRPFGVKLSYDGFECHYFIKAKRNNLVSSLNYKKNSH